MSNHANWSVNLLVLLRISFFDGRFLCFSLVGYRGTTAALEFVAYHLKFCLVMQNFLFIGHEFQARSQHLYLSIKIMQ